MNTDLLWLSQAGREALPALGNKAARLSQAYQAGFPVPPGFCLPVGLYQSRLLALGEERLAALVRARRYEAVRAWLQQEALPEQIRAPLLSQYRVLRQLARGEVAVRSSSTAEDLPGHSFAGLYTSLLGIGDEAALLQAVRDCWASYWNDEAAAYREQAGLDHLTHGMAVLVQAMVQPLVSGVFFTQAFAGETDTAVIEFVQGEGEKLVSGEAQASSLYVSKKSGRVYNAGSHSAEMDLTRLVSLGSAVERSQGQPQDIEWVMDTAGELWILQTRPITQFPRKRADARLEMEPGWLITYDEPFSTLGCELAVERYKQWVRAINDHFRLTFKPVMQNRDGLLYYRPSWRQVKLPLQLWMHFWQLAAWLLAAWTHRRYTGRILPDFERRLQALDREDLQALDPKKLLNGFNQAVQLYLEYQYTSYPIGTAATLSASLLDRACRLLFGPGRPWNALDFLTGLEDVSVRRGLEMEKLALTLREGLPETVLSVLDAAGLASARGKVKNGRRFEDQLQEFLQKFGYIWADRYPRDPAWELNQESVALSLSHAALQAPAGKTFSQRHAQQQARRSEAVRQAQERLGQGRPLPWRRLLFDWLLGRAERYFPYKEDRNHNTYRAVAVIRRYTREIGSRLAGRGMLRAAEDVFFLEREEIERLLWAPRPDARLLQRVDARRDTFEKTRRRVQRRPAQWNAVEPAGTQAGAGAFVELSGEVCSPGLARGPARFVSGLGELQRVQPGEILVCTQLRPAWSSVFARAGGVVIEMGSLLSHGSTLAREYGIPVVINVAGLTDLIRDGDWVTVDGNLGQVVVQRSAPAVEAGKWDSLVQQPG